MTDSWLSKKIEELHADIPAEAWEAEVYRQWLAEMYRSMDFLMKSGAWGAVNAFLGTLQKKSGDDMHKAIAALRFLSDAPRDELPGWSMLLWRVKVVIDRRGLDGKRLLRGLDDGEKA